jgi:hypothetical protein
MIRSLICFSLVTVLMGATLATVGCVSVQGGSERYKEMNVQAQWVDGVPEFIGDRPGGDDRRVTIQVRNPSGLDLNTRRLRAMLVASMEEEGWTVTKDPAEALYDITAVIKFWGRNENLPDDSSSMGKLLGTVAGGAIGVLILPLMLFHQIQLMVCAVLAQRYAKREEAPQIAAV